MTFPLVSAIQNLGIPIKSTLNAACSIPPPKVLQSKLIQILHVIPKTLLAELVESPHLFNPGQLHESLWILSPEFVKNTNFQMLFDLHLVYAVVIWVCNRKDESSSISDCPGSCLIVLRFERPYNNMVPMIILSLNQCLLHLFRLISKLIG